MDFLGVDIDKDRIEQEGSQVYETHLPLPKIQHGISKGELFRGKFFVDNNVCNSAVIMNRQYGIKIQINGYQNMNRALHGDIVAVKLLKREGIKI